MSDRRFSFYTYSRSGILQVVDDWHLIDFDPDYQRQGGVWSLEKKQYFIDSIINEMDLTKLYFHELSSGNASSNQYQVRRYRRQAAPRSNTRVRQR